MTIPFEYAWEVATPESVEDGTKTNTELFARGGIRWPAAWCQHAGLLSSLWRRRRTQNTGSSLWTISYTMSHCFLVFKPKCGPASSGGAMELLEWWNKTKLRIVKCFFFHFSVLYGEKLVNESQSGSSQPNTRRRRNPDIISSERKTSSIQTSSIQRTSNCCTHQRFMTLTSSY